MNYYNLRLFRSNLREARSSLLRICFDALILARMRSFLRMPHATSPPKRCRAIINAPVLLALSLAHLFGAPQPLSSQVGEDESMPSDYWHMPLASQGKAPVGWSELERSLAPEACGQCHIEQYEEWQTSLHAKAFSPGLVGQLLTYGAQQAAGCMQCHAPLAEQRQAFEVARARGDAHLPAAQGLAATGNSCAGCHLRRHRRFGPPQRDSDLTGQSDGEGAHGGVYRTAWFESSVFCGPCHQHPQAYAINGKPLENTLAEWQASSFSAESVTCQACHMPDRQHLWRGIHDPEMVASGLTARFSVSAGGAHFALTNSGVGHAFPTYITPRIEMRGMAIDSNGREVPETAVGYLIQRVVAFTDRGWVERSDTRLLPEQAATLTLPWQGYAKAKLWLEVSPDDFYDAQVYDALLTKLASDSAAAMLLARADRAAQAGNYRLFVTEVDRP